MSVDMASIIEISSLPSEDERDDALIQLLKEKYASGDQLFIPTTLMTERVYLETYYIIHKHYGHSFFSSIKQTEKMCLVFLEYYMSRAAMPLVVRNIKIPITHEMNKLVNKQKLVDPDLYARTKGRLIY